MKYYRFTIERYKVRIKHDQHEYPCCGLIFTESLFFFCAKAPIKNNDQLAAYTFCTRLKQIHIQKKIPAVPTCRSKMDYIYIFQYKNGVTWIWSKRLIG